MYARHSFETKGAEAVEAGVALAKDAVERASKLVASIDLSTITLRMMNMAGGPHWSEEKAKRVETRYRRFLQIALLYPGRGLSPTQEIDLYWHEHILHTRKYMSDCDRVFGRYLHHDAGFGGEEKDVGAKVEFDNKTAALYGHLFGENYFSLDSVAHCTVPTCVVDAVKSAASAHCTVPTCVVDTTNNAAAAHCTVPTCVVDGTSGLARAAHCTVPTCVVDVGSAKAQAAHCTVPTCVVDAGRKIASAAHCTVPTCVVDTVSGQAKAAHCTVPTCVVDTTANRADAAHCTVPTCVVDVVGARAEAAHCTVPTCVVDATNGQPSLVH